MIVTKEIITAAFLLLLIFLLFQTGLLVRAAYGIGFDRGYLKGQMSMLGVDDEKIRGEFPQEEKKDGTV